MDSSSLLEASAFIQHKTFKRFGAGSAKKSVAMLHTAALLGAVLSFVESTALFGGFAHLMHGKVRH